MKGRQKVSRHKRKIAGKWRQVKAYARKRRPKGKKRIISKVPTRLYRVTDEYGRHMGWKRKR